MPQRRSKRRSRRFRKSARGLAIAALLVLALAAIYWQRWGGEGGPAQPAALQPPPVAERAETRAPSPTAVAAVRSESVHAPVSSEALPPLDASDAFVRAAAAEISRHPSFAEWLAREELVRLFVVSVDNIAEGLTPSKHLPFLKPRGKFLVIGSDTALRIDPSGYHRYDRIADVFSSLDAEGCAELYFRIEPFIERAYREMGYPDRDFDDRLGEAIDALLAVPVAPEDPALVEEVLRYEFADPELEALSDAQKHLLRMGPRNVQRIQNKLRELAQAAGIRAGR
jgi:hypothetical protein